MAGSNDVARTFVSLEEILAVEGFKPENPVSTGNYASLLGDYHLPEKVQCCIQKKSGLCLTPHNHGYVVRLKDGTASIIGNHCANAHFDAKDRVMQDRSRFLNLQRRQRAQARVAELLQGREAAIARIRALDDDLRAHEAWAREVRERVGDGCWYRLPQRASDGGTGSVAAKGVRIRHETDASGRRSTERTEFGIPVGTLHGVRCLNSYLVRSIREDLRQVKLAYDELALANDETSTTKLEQASSRAAGLADAERRKDALIDQAQAFKAADWLPMIFLVRGDSDRARVGRVVLTQRGTPGGKDKAKDLIKQVEAQLRATHNADRIEIP